ncbi:hypothetical protein ABH19_03940 [Leptospirillum sp. Group II 'CF-1']|nr:hypothetical protein ABH19_03940 [Leptospirillum sp. Group II 'CF-1']
MRRQRLPARPPEARRRPAALELPQRRSRPQQPPTLLRLHPQNLLHLQHPPRRLLRQQRSLPAVRQLRH